MFLTVIPIVGSIFDFISGNIITILGGTGAIVLTVASWLSKKYLVPYLTIEKRRKYASYIAAIADDVTDELRVKYPNQTWTKYLDEAVDKVIDICDIDQEIARRAVSAAVGRK
ncbi:MAG: hypothetical protein ABIJ45_10395 [Candidatus Zixiibacteriota bacterium]